MVLDMGIQVIWTRMGHMRQDIEHKTWWHGTQDKGHGDTTRDTKRDMRAHDIGHGDTGHGDMGHRTRHGTGHGTQDRTREHMTQDTGTQDRIRDRTRDRTRDTGHKLLFKQERSD